MYCRARWSVQSFKATVAHGAFEQAHHIAAFFALFDGGKDRVQLGKVAVQHGRRVLGTHVHAVARQIAFGQHFLRNECFVGQRIVALEGVARQCGQAPVVNLQAVFVGQLLPA